jgi:hypothetical protein
MVLSDLFKKETVGFLLALYAKTFTSALLAMFSGSFPWGHDWNATRDSRALFPVPLTYGFAGWCVLPDCAIGQSFILKQTVNGQRGSRIMSRL